MTTRQKFYIRLIKRPIGFLGALVGILIMSPIILGKHPIKYVYQG